MQATTETVVVVMSSALRLISGSATTKSIDGASFYGQLPGNALPDSDADRITVAVLGDDVPMIGRMGPQLTTSPDLKEFCAEVEKTYLGTAQLDGLKDHLNRRIDFGRRDKLRDFCSDLLRCKWLINTLYYILDMQLSRTRQLFATLIQLL